jgi:hypothetical protein
MKPHVPLLVTLALVASACGNSSSPTPAAALTFTISPNPVPYAGLSVFCESAPAPEKSWFYTMRIDNTGSAPFELSSFSSTINNGGGTPPVTTPPAGRDLFTRAFGAATIPSKGSVQGSLCVRGNWESTTQTWNLTGANGETFSSPPVQYLP